VHRYSGYQASLELRKIYAALSDPDAAKGGDIRIIDESGDDLYGNDRFVPLEVPERVEASILRTVR
jgi:hypothetical protein